MKDLNDHAFRHLVAQVKAEVPYVLGKTSWTASDCSGAINLMLASFGKMVFEGRDPTAEEMFNQMSVSMASDYSTHSSTTPKGSTITLYQPLPSADILMHFWRVKESVWSGLTPQQQGGFGNMIFHVSVSVKRGRRWVHFMQSSYMPNSRIGILDEDSFIYSDRLNLFETGVDYPDIMCDIIPARWIDLTTSVFSIPDGSGYVSLPEPPPMPWYFRRFYWGVPYMWDPKEETPENEDLLRKLRKWGVRKFIRLLGFWTWLSLVDIYIYWDALKSWFPWDDQDLEHYSFGGTGATRAIPDVSIPDQMDKWRALRDAWGVID